VVKSRVLWTAFEIKNQNDTNIRRQDEVKKGVVEILYKVAVFQWQITAIPVN
jgi:hypothetical protein